MEVWEGRDDGEELGERQRHVGGGVGQRVDVHLLDEVVLLVEEEGSAGGLHETQQQVGVEVRHVYDSLHGDTPTDLRLLEEDVVVVAGDEAVHVLDVVAQTVRVLQLAGNHLVLLPQPAVVQVRVEEKTALAVLQILQPKALIVRAVVVVELSIVRLLPLVE